MKTRLRAWREAQGISREELAERIGCSASMLGFLENGARCSPALAERVRALFGEDLEDLQKPAKISNLPRGAKKGNAHAQR